MYTAIMGTQRAIIERSIGNNRFRTEGMSLGMAKLSKFMRAALSLQP
jgi:hypothetical protein